LTHSNSVNTSASVPRETQLTFLGIRFVLYIFFVPFLVRANPLCFDFNESEAGTLRRTRILGFSLLCIGFVSLIIGGLLHLWEPPPILGLPTENRAEHPIRHPRAAMCHAGSLDWNMARVAGLSLYPEIARWNETSNSSSDEAEVQNLNDVLGVDHVWSPHKSPPGYLAPPSFIFVQPQRGQPQHVFIAFPGTRTLNDLAFMIENIMVAWVREGLMIIIPFYRIARDLFFRAYDLDMSETISLVILGPNRLFVNYWFKGIWFVEAGLKLLRTSFWSLQWIENITGTSELEVKAVVGHGSYGLLAKGLGWHNGWPGIAFDSSPFFDSPLSIFETWTPKSSTQSSWTADFYSGRSLQILPEHSTMNSESHIMRNFGGFFFFQTPTTEETFCIVAAGCATDDRFDLICNSLLEPKDRFSDMFEKWNRSRASESSGSSTKARENQGKL
jgi:hypothetical protein